MYFPCQEMLPFLTMVDLKTKESANEESFRQHGSELLHVLCNKVEKDTTLWSSFCELLGAKVDEIDHLSLESIDTLFKELVCKLCHTRVQEFLDSFKQNAIAQTGSATLSGVNLRDYLLSHHVNLKSE